jgi:drug/metabolite transporter (DMT)-like permease
MHPAAETPARARIALAVVAAVLAMLLYGGQFVVSRWSMQRTLSLWDLAALRFAVAGLLCLPLALRRGAGVSWGRLLVLAAAAGAPYTLILFAGLTLAPAAHGAVIITGGTPVLSALMTWAWLGERPRAASVAGFAAIVAGLVLASLPGLHAGTGSRVWLGDLFFVVAGVLWALYTVCARRWHVDPIRVTAAVWALAFLYVPIYAALAGARVLEAPRGEIVFQGVYQGIGVAICALGLYSLAIRVLGAPVASLFMPLTPIFGVLLGVPILGEVPSAVQVIGMVAVGAGMVAGQMPTRGALPSVKPPPAGSS